MLLRPEAKAAWQDANTFDAKKTCTCLALDETARLHRNLRKSGEPVGIRTRDLLIKSQLLYQLSYRPTRRLFRKTARGGQPQKVHFMTNL